MTSRPRRSRPSRDTLASLGSVVVAYSGGVDSAYLACVAARTLGDRAVAVTADSPSYPERHRRLAIDDRARVRPAPRDHPHERARAPRVPRQPGQPLLLLQARALHAPVAHRRRRAARSSSTATTPTIAATTGPGRQAAREFGVRSPLDEVGPRRRTRSASCRARAGLPTWDEPASACLSSRIPYHTEVTDEKLRTIERAEQALRALGFRVCRVRHHDELARVEIARDEMPRALEPEIARGDRARAEGARLPLRHARPAGLPHGQPERRAVCSACRAADAGAPARVARRPRARLVVAVALALPRASPAVPPAVARRSRLDQLRARRPPLRRRASPAASARLSRLHRCSRRPCTRVVPAGGRARSRCSSVVAGALGVLALVALFRRLDARAGAPGAVDARRRPLRRGDGAAVLVHRRRGR